MQSFELGAMQHAEEAGEFFAFGGIDRADARVRIGAQQRPAVRETGQFRQVLDILGAAGDFFLQIEAWLALPMLPALGFHFLDPRSLIARQTFSGVSGTFCMRTPIASSTALHTAGATARMPPSPMPFAP